MYGPSSKKKSSDARKRTAIRIPKENLKEELKQPQRVELPLQTEAKVDERAEAKAPVDERPEPEEPMQVEPIAQIPARAADIAKLKAELLAIQEQQARLDEQQRRLQEEFIEKKNPACAARERLLEIRNHTDFRKPFFLRVQVGIQELELADGTTLIQVASLVLAA